jgi:hypothetical protein
MNSYRFSSSDRKALYRLFDGFCSVYKFTVGRQPSVYYDTFERFSGKYPQMARLENLSNLESPDYFGFYYVESPLQMKDPTETGTIFLFKDRIEDPLNHPNVTQGNPDKLRKILLLQCMADFFIHWACKDNIRWRYGFSCPMPTIRAGLSRLITHACCMDESDFEYLQSLTPLRENRNWNLQFQQGFESVDMSKPGGFYIRLLGINRELVLNKVTELRKAYWLNEQTKLEFLLSEQATVDSFLEHKAQENPSIRAIEILFTEDYFDIPKIKEMDLASFQKLHKVRRMSNKFGLGSSWEGGFFLNEENGHCQL